MLKLSLPGWLSDLITPKNIEIKLVICRFKWSKSATTSFCLSFKSTTSESSRSNNLNLSIASLEIVKNSEFKTDFSFQLIQSSDLIGVIGVFKKDFVFNIIHSFKKTDGFVIKAFHNNQRDHQSNFMRMCIFLLSDKSFLVSTILLVFMRCTVMIGFIQKKNPDFGTDVTYGVEILRSSSVLSRKRKNFTFPSSSYLGK